ncbi:MAG: elongation factor 4 [Chloroflexi bacterium]|nr:elongation factor 4 [Chloroflexota bacterium]
MDQAFIRNFSIIAHVDHGKSTLADRLLERTNTVSAREMHEQYLDQMTLERERGITIKAQAVRMHYTTDRGTTYELNLIDTPGHVDFSYEVSRSLAACEGAILVVDATQGIQAQTLAHTGIAMDLGLEVIPVINKIDLPNAQPERVAQEIEEALALFQHEVLSISAKEGTGIADVLESVVRRIPPPKGDPEAPLRALVFDSKYDPYKGVLAYVRIFDGSVRPGQPLQLMSSGRSMDPLEVGVFAPQLQPVEGLSCGEVGYIATGLKDVRDCRVGETITEARRPATAPLPGYNPLKPMVFAGFYPAEGSDSDALRDAIEKLQLNDAALSFEPEASVALGFGFRCGFLGMLHMDIVRERLEREYGLSVLITAPSVAYEVAKSGGSVVTIRNPSDLPDPGVIQEVREPWIKAVILVPHTFIGPVMDLMTERRGQYVGMEYLRRGEALGGQARVLLEYEMPLAEMLSSFFDQLKSRTQGYASLDYTPIGYRPSPLVKLDILVHEQPVDALSVICHRDEAYHRGRALVERLRHLIPRQLFDVPIQAAIGKHVISRETVKALRKNVLAKCYGGDVTRKRKLLEKQAEGKKRMRRIGRVEVPQEAFLAILQLEKES